MRKPVVTVDRAKLDEFVNLAEVIERHLGKGEIVHVVDGTRPAGEQLRDTLQWTRGACRVFNGLGRPLGVFSDLDALIEHAEAATT